MKEIRLAQAEWASLPADSRPRVSPIMQYAAQEKLEALRVEYEKTNDGWHVLIAVRKCAASDLVMPDWLADAYCRRFDQVLNCQMKSWDEAFNPPYPKGTHLNRKRADRLNRFKVFNDIAEILERDPETPINEELFERIGKKLGIGKTKANELYYETKKLMSHFHGN